MRSLQLSALLVPLLLAAAATAYTLPPYNTQCRQVTGDGVAIRASPSLSAAAEAERLWKCYRVHYLGVKVTSGGLDWAKIWWNGKERWVAAQYLVSVFWLGGGASRFTLPKLGRVQLKPSSRPVLPQLLLAPQLSQWCLSRSHYNSCGGGGHHLHLHW